jgi:hypothetical protein
MFYRVYRREVDELRAKIKAGTAKDCFAVQLLAAPETAKLGETQMLFALGSIMEAESDTSRMTISQILAAAATDTVICEISVFLRICQNQPQPRFSHPKTPFLL